MTIILYLIFGYLILLIVTPKATNLHEFLHIPNFWLRNFLVKKDNLITQKVKFGTHRHQYLLFYQPKKKKASKKNIILYFNGGGWIAGTPEMLKSSAQVLADEGYISIFGSYRKTPFHSYPEMREDLTLCLQAVKKIQRELDLEDKKIIIGGMSAGATLAALLCFQKKELDQISFDRNQIAGLLLCGPPVDLAQMKWSIPLYLYAGNHGSKKFHLANPANQITSDIDFPILIIHGNKDGLVPYRNTISFLEKINANTSSKTQLYTIPDGTHMDAASWGYENNKIRSVIFDWLEKNE